MSETKLVKDIQILASRLGLRLFRNNVGMAWFGKKIIKFKNVTEVIIYPGDIVIRGAYPVRYGLCVGSGDLIGLDNEGKFVSVEGKFNDGKLTEEQSNFMNMVNSNGGRAIVARSTEEFKEKIK